MTGFRRIKSRAAKPGKKASRARSNKTQTSLRLPTETLSQLRAIAKLSCTSLDQVVSVIVATKLVQTQGAK